ncbi:MAG: VOC family protein [Candidatus Pacebacteria bacterium]|nr:VOC family protein [Candidatus Paceibacterota bacterium]
MKPRINALYLSVKDMKRAVKFYENVFNVKVSLFNERISSFDFEIFTFLLFNPKIDNEKLLIGNNIIPNIEVENIKKMLKLIKNKECEIIMPLKKIDKYSIFQTRDTEGNIIEFYQLEN